MCITKRADFLESSFLCAKCCDLRTREAYKKLKTFLDRSICADLKDIWVVMMGRTAGSIPGFDTRPYDNFFKNFFQKHIHIRYIDL